MRRGMQLANVADSVLNRNFEAVTQAINDLGTAPLADSIDPTQYSLTTGSNTVNHGLGRKPKGAIVTSKSAAVDVRFDRTASTTNDRTAVLQAAGNAVVDVIWF